MNRLVKKLSARYQCLHFCYEAGPCGYGLHRQLTALGHQCDVVARHRQLDGLVLPVWWLAGMKGA